MQVQGRYDARVFLADQMTRAQGLRLRRLSEEAYQPAQYARDLSFCRGRAPHPGAGGGDRAGEFLSRHDPTRPRQRKVRSGFPRDKRAPAAAAACDPPAAHPGTTPAVGGFSGRRERVDGTQGKETPLLAQRR